AADFQDCKTLEQVLIRLNEKFGEPLEARMWGGGWRWPFVQYSEPANNILVQYPAESCPMPLKQFLRMTFAQAGVEDVGFIVRNNRIEATTMKRVEAERARYLESVSLFDRMKTAWRDLMGEVEDDPPVIMTITTY